MGRDQDDIKTSSRRHQDGGKKKAQIKIQAVAKIQYPIKSLTSNANRSPPGFKAEMLAMYWGN
jgi:hypothetical protein